MGDMSTATTLECPTHIIVTRRTYPEGVGSDGQKRGIDRGVWQIAARTTVNGHPDRFLYYVNVADEEQVILLDVEAEERATLASLTIPEQFWTNHDLLVILTGWMAREHRFGKADLAYAVEKPWKFADEFAEALIDAFDDNPADLIEVWGES